MSVYLHVNVSLQYMDVSNQAYVTLNYVITRRPRLYAESNELKNKNDIKIWYKYDIKMAQRDADKTTVRRTTESKNWSLFFLNMHKM